MFFRTDSIIILRGDKEIEIEESENKELTPVTPQHTEKEGMLGISEQTRTFTSSTHLRNLSYR